MIIFHALASASLWSQYQRYSWIGIVAVVLLLVAVIGWYIARVISRRIDRRNDAEMALLRGLEGSSSLTEEERKKVRAALTRKYMQSESTPTKRANTGLSPLQELALEAQQRLDELKQRKSTPDEEPPETALPEKKVVQAEMPPPPTPTASSPASDLPPMMRRLLDKSDIELEDMVAAGLLTEEDYQWVRRARSRPS